MTPQSPPSDQSTLCVTHSERFRQITDKWIGVVACKPLSCWARIYPAFANSVDPDQLARSVGFWRSQLIWICTVCHQVCDFIATIRIKQSDWLKISSRFGIIIYSAGQGLSTSMVRNYGFRIRYLKLPRVDAFHYRRNSYTCKNVYSGICEQRRSRSARASAQSDQDLHCSLTESLDTTDHMKREHFVHAQDDQNLHILRIIEGTFSLDTSHICFCSN